MEKFRKVLALMLALVMVMSMSACGMINDGAAITGDVAATTGDGAATTDEIARVGDPFYVYSWNTEIGDRLEYFKKAYPEEGARIVYVNTGGSDTYQEKMDAILSTPDAEQYPDLMGLEADYIKKYVSSDYTMDIAQLGITPADYANQYEYTLKIPTDERNNTIKALSWQATPGSMMYRRSLAIKYLGTDDPTEVQAYFKDWDTMIATAKTIDEKSSGTTKLFSGNDDVFRVYMADRQQAWVVEGKLTVDDSMLKYMDFNKTLEQDDFTNKTSQWSEEWNANAASDNTFAYMGCTWFLHWVLKANSGGAAAGEGTYGDWAMCQGPQEYYWGGTWLAASQNCSDTELAGLIMKFMTCDTDNMYNIAADTLDYVNNKASVEKLIADGMGANDFIDGQDCLAVFADLAAKVDVSTMTAFDQNINSAFDVQVKEYALGNKDKDTAIADFKAAVLDLYPTLTTD